MAGPSSPRGTRSRQPLSLEWKLPLLMTSGIAGALAVTLVCTDAVLSRRAEGIVRDRLAHAAHEVSRTVASSLTQRASDFHAIAADTAVRRLLAQTSSREHAMAAAREAVVRIAHDTTHPIELLDNTGRHVASLGAPLAPEDEAHLASLLRLDRAGMSADSVAFSPMETSTTNGRFWVVAPVVDNGRSIGAVVSPRLVSGQREYLRMLREFMREDVDFFVRNADGTGWIVAPGLPAAAPKRSRTSRGIVDERPDVGPTVVEESPVPGSPWVTVLESSESVLFSRRVNATLELLIALSLGVLAVGAIVSWLVGRRIARPIIRLTEAAESLSGGNYAGNLPQGADEIGRLASSFDAMARRVAAAQQELEHRAAEAEVARRDAEAANRAKSDFLAMMSHELRTPLNAIGGYTQLLDLGIHGPVNDAQRAALQRIQRSQNHLLTLIGDLLDFARIDAGQVRFDIRNVDVQELLGGMDALIGPQMRAKSLRFCYEPGDEPLIARGDPDKIRQIIVNLLSNAVKYTPVGGDVELRCEPATDTVKIHVRDTGIGIPRDRIDEIFKPFVQAERSLNRPLDGVGLGLTISRELAAGMDGSLTATSQPGLGSTFTLTLPRAADRAVSPPRVKLQQPGALV